MPIYDSTDFDPALIPTHLKRDVRKLVEVAVTLGWKFHLSRGNAVTLVSYDERKKYHLSKRSSISYNRMFNDVVKYADPRMAENSMLLSDLGMPPEFIKKVAAVGAVQRVEEEEPTTPLGTPAGLATRPDPIPVYANGSTEQEAEKVEHPTEVSRKPMMAKAREGQGYDSPTTDVVVWSDGSTTYECRAPGCGYSSADNRKSVSSHYARAHAVGNSSKPITYEAEVSEAHHYAPRKGRIEALAARLREAWEDGTEPDFEALATEALTWVHEQSTKGTDLAAEAEDMTPEEMIARIRAVLDDGSAFDLRRQMDSMSERVLELQAQVAEERKRADDAVDTLHTLAELARDADKREAS